MENFGYLFAAYSVIFAAIAIYVVFIWRRQARLDADLRALERRLADLSNSINPAGPANPERLPGGQA